MEALRELALMTVDEIRAALQECQAVIIPVGCVEQHGYHLPIETDVLTATAVARGAAERTGAFLAPPVFYSFSGGELPGTVNVSPEVTSLYLREIGAGLASMGFGQLVFVTGHCGTEHMAALKGACEALARGHPEAAVAWVPLFEASPMWVEAAQQGDFHAGWVETSLLQHIAPELVRASMAVDDEPLAQRMRRDPDAYKALRKTSENRFEVPHARQDPQIRVGVMGYPELSSAEKGAVVLAEATQTVADLVEDLMRAGRAC